MPPLELVQAVSANTFSVCFHFKFKQKLKRSSGDSQGKECLAFKIHGGSDLSFQSGRLCKKQGGTSEAFWNEIPKGRICSG